MRKWRPNLNAVSANNMKRYKKQSDVHEITIKENEVYLQDTAASWSLQFGVINNEDELFDWTNYWYEYKVHILTLVIPNIEVFIPRSRLIYHRHVPSDARQRPSPASRHDSILNNGYCFRLPYNRTWAHEYIISLTHTHNAQLPEAIIDISREATPSRGLNRWRASAHVSSALGQLNNIAVGRD